MSSYETKSEEIEVCGNVFVVHQADTMRSGVRSVLMGVAEKSWEGIELDKEDVETFVSKYIETIVYPSYIAVTESKGEPLPTLEEFKKMPDEDRLNWGLLVEKLNPTFFPDESQEKKSSLTSL